MNLRRLRRAVALALALVYCLLRSWLSRLFGPDTLECRVAWNHSSAMLVIKLLGIRLKVTGNPPQRGLLVANHLSYLDILIFGAALPCCLVSKIEISRWPFFGPLARAGGTLFIDRSSLASAQAVTAQIAERLQGSVPVLFFPEGTSTDGAQVLPFHARLFTPAVVVRAPITAIAVRYVPSDASPESSLCWFGDAPFLPHIWQALGAADFTAEVHFAEPRIFTDRRTAAKVTHAEVETMRETGVLAER